MHIVKRFNIDFPTIIFSLYLGLSLIRFVFPSLLITIAMIVTGLVPLLILNINNIRLNKYCYILIIFLLIYYILSCIILDRYEAMPRNILHIISCFSIALLLLFEKVRSWGVNFIFYALFLYFLTFIIRGMPAEAVLDYSSWNGISMLIIVSCTSLYIVNSFTHKNINLIPAVLTFIVSFWGMGRSGILASGILIFGLFILKYNKFKYFKSVISFKNIITLITFFIILLFTFLLLNDYILDSFNSTMSIVNRDTDDISMGRVDILNNYYNNLNLFRLTFGSNIFTDPWPDGEKLAYNLHNSFLNLHSYTGLMGILFIILIISACINFLHNNKLFFILFFVLLIRGTTDILFFFESWDFLIFFFIIYYIKNRNNIDTNYHLNLNNR